MAKIIKDPIHGSISLPRLLMKYVDTPQFQRLRRLRQLGPVHHVYPTMNHTRFEHSIGVAHLAGVVVDHIQETCGLTVRTRQKQLIQLAGLLHDTGHGPYSHLWDDFLAVNNSINLPKHEERSVQILKQITADLHRKSSETVITEEEILFIENIITGKSATCPPWFGQIINNTLCGIDVDKLDYLCRDAYHGGLPGIDTSYIIANIRVDSQGNLAFRSTAQEAIKDIYYVRGRLHSIVYQHPTVLKFKMKYMEGMSRLFGDTEIPYFSDIDDFSLETALRADETTAGIMDEIDARSFLNDLPEIPTRANRQTWNLYRDLIPFV